MTVKSVLEGKRKADGTKKHCPFCGQDSWHILSPSTHPERSTHQKGFQVECLNCGARGPCGMAGPLDAEIAWGWGDDDLGRYTLSGKRVDS